MMYKRSCTECLSVLPIIDFPKSGGGGGNGGIDTNGNPYRRHQCKPCHWERKKRLPSGRLENRKRLNNYKHDSSCSCGYSHKRDGNNFHTRALTFHHKDDNKVVIISVPSAKYLNILNPKKASISNSIIILKLEF